MLQHGSLVLLLCDWHLVLGAEVGGSRAGGRITDARLPDWCALVLCGNADNEEGHEVASNYMSIKVSQHFQFMCTGKRMQLLTCEPSKPSKGRDSLGLIAAGDKPRGYVEVVVQIAVLS